MRGLGPWQAVFAAGVVAGIYLALGDPSGQAPLWFAQADKVQHALGFLALWLVGSRAWPGRPIALALGLLSLGVGIEVAQSFTPLRQASLGDVLADAFGLAVGAAFTRGRRAAPGPVGEADPPPAVSTDS